MARLIIYSQLFPREMLLCCDAQPYVGHACACIAILSFSTQHLYIVSCLDSVFSNTYTRVMAVESLQQSVR